MPRKRTLVLDEYRLIHELAAEGARDSTIARELRVSPATWKAIKSRDAKAIAAMRWGRRDFFGTLIPMLDLFDPLPGNK